MIHEDISNVKRHKSYWQNMMFQIVIRKDFSEKKTFKRIFGKWYDGGRRENLLRAPWRQRSRGDRSSPGVPVSSGNSLCGGSLERGEQGRQLGVSGGQSTRVEPWDPILCRISDWRVFNRAGSVPDWCFKTSSESQAGIKTARRHINNLR